MARIPPSASPRKHLGMAAITTWIALGGGIGLLASLGSPRWSPAGWAGAVAVGAAGAFVGGGLLTVPPAGRSVA